MHKKTGVLAALLLVTLAFFASMPAARADPGFTLEDVKTWYWIDSTYIESVAVGDVDGDAQNSWSINTKKLLYLCSIAYRSFNF